MTTDLSIIPFLRHTLLAAFLVSAVGCYEMDDFYNPAVPGDQEEDSDSEANSEGSEDEDTGDDSTGEDSLGTDSEDDPADPEPGNDSFECALGEHVEDLDSDHFLAEDFEQLVRPQDLSDLEGRQLLEGLAAWPWTDPVDLFDFFGLVDDGRLMVRPLELLDSDQSFTQLRFSIEGEEFGYLFARGSLRLSASIDDGWIVGCTVPMQ